MENGLNFQQGKDEEIRKRSVGTTARGIRGPIIRPGDDLADIVVQSLREASRTEGIVLRNNDIVGITEAVVAKAQKNFATLEEVAQDIRIKFGSNQEIGIVFPILSRNRFSKILEAISMAASKVYIQLSYPHDEVGNHLISQEQLDATSINPYSDSLSEERFYSLFGDIRHKITGVDYIQLYKSICDGKAEVVLSNDPAHILQYTPNVIAADIHTRQRTKGILRKSGAEAVYGLDELMNAPVGNSGYNPEYGLLGSNLSSEDNLKLFPRECTDFVRKVQQKVLSEFGVNIQVLVYGDGAYKDPASRIWELADPVVSPGFTEGLGGMPSELKLKYVADTELKGLPAEAAEILLKGMIKDKEKQESIKSEGTTPREIASLVGSLCDLITGSGDKGTPFVLISGYFDNFADE